ncbi:MAG: cache domain-containing protein [Eubacteriales bacterium]|nr:cache domain-containing protein [Eubacteriales bacterium]
MKKMESNDWKVKNEDQKRQYIMTLVIILLALLVIVGYTFGSFYKITRQDAIALGKNAVEEEAAQMNNFLLKGTDVMQVTELTVSYMMKNGADSQEIEAFLQQQSKDYEEYISQGFTGIYGWFRGEYLDGSGWVPPENYIPKERPWYTEAQQGNGELVVVSPYLDTKTNTILFSVAKVLDDGDSVISFDIAMDDVQDIAENIRLNGNGYGFVVDDQGMVVAHHDEWEKGKNYLMDEDQQDSDMQKLVKQVYQEKDQDNISFEMEIDGEECMVFSQTVQEKWHVILIVNYSDLFQKIQNNLFRNLLVSLFIFLVVGYFCTSSYRNRKRAIHYAEQLQEYQLNLEDRVEEQTREIREQSQKMIQLQENVVEGMATLIESRDGDTGQHVRSTKRYVAMMVDYMYEHRLHPDEVDQEYMTRICNAAPLHDVGKIMISDTILNKPGRFTPEEFAVMQTHSEIGGRIVKDILGEGMDQELIQIASDVAHYHHEKWDGSGYPEGLKGTEIPLSARIMAVADVFDALVSKRVYKDAMGVEEAYAILQEDAGTHFDPELVDIFVKIRNQVEAYLKSLR